MYFPRWRASRSLAIFFALALLVSGAPALHAAPSLPPVLETVGNAQQVVLVQAPRWNSTTGTLTTFERTSGTWRRVLSPVAATLGYGGLVPGNKRRQGTGTTPTGAYAITSSFGRKANPGTELNYVRVDRNDAWTYNPAYPSTYNIFQTVNRSWSSYGKYVERLYSYGKQYNYVAVLDYNLPPGKITRGANGVNRTSAPANTTLGGGIFLHATNGRKTAGCIAVKESVMKNILQWVDPGLNPVMVIQVD